jgi:hypothetical protein
VLKKRYDTRSGHILWFAADAEHEE